MFTGIIKLDKLCSVNTAHKIGRAGNKSWIYLDPLIVQMQKSIEQQLIDQNVHAYFKDLKGKDLVYEVEIIFAIKENFFKRDTTNIIKYVEDAIASATEINDAYHVKVSAKKVLNNKDDFEYIIIVIQEQSKDSVINMKDLQGD